MFHNMACCFEFLFQWWHYDQPGKNTKEEAAQNTAAIAALDWPYREQNDNSSNEPLIQRVTDKCLSSFLPK